MNKGCIAVSILLMLALLCGVAGAESAVDLMVGTRTTQAFTDETVTDADLRAILEAGLAAPSAINQQPWHFVAVTNRAVLDEIKGSAGGFPGGPGGPGGFPGGKPEGDMPAPPQGMAGGAKAGLGDSPVAIIVYMDEQSKSPNASFDCGLACENMLIAAKSLGYGAKIVSSPTMQLNGENHDTLCEKLGVDKSMTAVAVLLIGREAEGVDGASGASVRSAIEEKVSFVE